MFPFFFFFFNHYLVAQRYIYFHLGEHCGNLRPEFVVIEGKF